MEFILTEDNLHEIAKNYNFGDFLRATSKEFHQKWKSGVTSVTQIREKLREDPNFYKDNKIRCLDIDTHWCGSTKLADSLLGDTKYLFYRRNDLFDFNSVFCQLSNLQTINYGGNFVQPSQILVKRYIHVNYVLVLRPRVVSDYDIFESILVEEADLYLMNRIRKHFQTGRNQLPSSFEYLELQLVQRDQRHHLRLIIRDFSSRFSEWITLAEDLEVHVAPCYAEHLVSIIKRFPPKSLVVKIFDTALVADEDVLEKTTEELCKIPGIQFLHVEKFE